MLGNTVMAWEYWKHVPEELRDEIRRKNGHDPCLDDYDFIIWMPDSVSCCSRIYCALIDRSPYDVEKICELDAGKVFIQYHA